MEKGEVTFFLYLPPHHHHHVFHHLFVLVDWPIGRQPCLWREGGHFVAPLLITLL